MIVDKIENAPLYYGLGAGIEKALRYIASHDLTDAPPGKSTIEENKVFVSVMEYDTKPIDKCLLEAHRKNIDVQYMIAADEKIGFAYLGQFEPTTQYDDEKDIQFFGRNTDDFFNLKQGMFAIFFPTDLHMPAMETSSSKKIKKAVFKVRV